MTEKDNLIEDLENKLMGLDMNEKLTDRVLWDSIKNKNTNLYTNKIKYLLSEFGTSQPCNRFNVGNTIEFIMTEFLIDKLNNKNEINIIKIPRITVAIALARFCFQNVSSLLNSSTKSTTPIPLTERRANASFEIAVFMNNLSSVSLMSKLSALK